MDQWLVSCQSLCTLAQDSLNKPNLLIELLWQLWTTESTIPQLMFQIASYSTVDPLQGS
jgi:hypothetical protein